MARGRVTQVGSYGERTLFELIPQHIFGQLIHCGNHKDTQNQHYGRIGAADLPLKAYASLFLIHLVSSLLNSCDSPKHYVLETNSHRFLPICQRVDRIRSSSVFLRKASRDWPNANLITKEPLIQARISRHESRASRMPYLKELLHNFSRTYVGSCEPQAMRLLAYLFPAMRYDAGQNNPLRVPTVGRDDRFSGRTRRELLPKVYETNTHILFYFDLSNGKSPGHEKSATIRSLLSRGPIA
jgi:hypothetical protein